MEPTEKNFKNCDIDSVTHTIISSFDKDKEKISLSILKEIEDRLVHPMYQGFSEYIISVSINVAPVLGTGNIVEPQPLFEVAKEIAMQIHPKAYTDEFSCNIHKYNQINYKHSNDYVKPQESSESLKDLLMHLMDEEDSSIQCSDEELIEKLLHILPDEKASDIIATVNKFMIRNIKKGNQQALQQVCIAMILKNTDSEFIAESTGVSLRDIKNIRSAIKSGLL